MLHAKRHTMETIDWRAAAAARGLEVSDLARHVGTQIQGVDLGDDHDAEMVAIAPAIIEQRTGTFDPKTYKDRYQEALRELIEAQDQGAPHQAAARPRRRRSRSRRSFIDASRHCSYRYPVAERGRRGLLSGQPRSLRGGARRHERCNTRNPLLLRDGPARSRQSSHIQYSYLIAIRLTPNIGHLTINFIAHSTSTV